MENNLTQGKIFSKILLFALPIILGGLLQEVYQLTDTMIVGQTLGSMKLGAVGSTGALVFWRLASLMALQAGARCSLRNLLGPTRRTKSERV